MQIIPTPQEAVSYHSDVAGNPDLITVLAVLIAAIERAHGGSTWVDQSAVPGALFSQVRTLLARKHWIIDSGFNSEENYHFYELKPCGCLHCS